MNKVEIKVLVPEARIAEFYKAYATFLEPEATTTDSDGHSPSRRSGRSRSSSYAALGEYLAGQRKNMLTLKFSEIESVLSRPLPASAYRHRAWWANTESHSQAATWLQRGWRASDLDLEKETVTFTRSAS